jgi:putative transposase
MPKVMRAHKIRLYPNNKQATYFAKACGVARFTYNWGLENWKRQYEAGKKPTANGLSKEFNAIKRGEFPFVQEVTKYASQIAFAHLDKAFRNFFRRCKGGGAAGYPKFKKKGVKDSFSIGNDAFRVNGKKIRIPRLGWVRMAESLRLAGKIMSATISRKADRWFVSVLVEIDVPDSESQASGAVGVDLGLKKLATLSDGTVFENPRLYAVYARKLRKAHKDLARKKKGSKNRQKAKDNLAKLYYKIQCISQDSLHKMTRYVASNYKTVCIEDLDIASMMGRKAFNRALASASLGEILRQLTYKAGDVRIVDRYFPSTKLCPECGGLNNLSLGERAYRCNCGYGPVDRDLHAAKNILAQGLGEVKPVET